MAVTTTWSILDMKRTASDGNVYDVRWQCLAQNDAGSESAVEAGKLILNADPSDTDFIPYADLTEADVLGWVYESLVEGDETADEAKARVEANRTAKVVAQIERANADASGLPWSA
jgi:hypothetical protein